MIVCEKTARIEMVCGIESAKKAQSTNTPRLRQFSPLPTDSSQYRPGLRTEPISSCFLVLFYSKISIQLRNIQADARDLQAGCCGFLSSGRIACQYLLVESLIGAKNPKFRESAGSLSSAVVEYLVGDPISSSCPES